MTAGALRVRNRGLAGYGLARVPSWAQERRCAVANPKTPVLHVLTLCSNCDRCFVQVLDEDAARRTGYCEVSTKCSCGNAKDPDIVFAADGNGVVWARAFAEHLADPDPDASLN